jgi:anti-anti-sigma regulatory factor
MADIVVEDRESSKLLRLTGDLAVDQAAVLTAELAEIVADADEIGIDLSSVTHVDVACLQVLCAAHKSSVRKDKPLKVEGSVPEGIARTARDAGFGRVCSLKTLQGCLWDGADDA